MPIKKRLVRVTIKLAAQTITLTEDLDLKIRVSKAALAIQSRATIEVGGLSQSLRQGLLTQFTAFRKRLKTNEGLNADDYLDVVISAGYQDIYGIQTLTPIFHGQITLVDPIGAPPDITVRITAYTNQVDRTTYIQTQPPSPISFKSFCTWCAGLMNLTPNISTSIDDKTLYNPAARTYYVAALLPWIQAYDRQNIAAWIDDDTLFVRDIGKVVTEDQVVEYKQFVGSPMWSEWGVDFRIMFDPQLKLAGGCKVTSKLNPTMSTSDLIIMKIEYDICSREDPFCANITTAPSA